MSAAEPPVTVAWGAASDPGLRRALNEDSFLAAPPLFLVADGMGGHRAGEIASATVIEEFASYAGRPSLSIEDMHTRRRPRAPSRGRALAGRAAPAPAPPSSGVVICEVDGEGYWLAVNLGDSRTYRLSEGELEQISVDHSVVQELIDSGVLTADAAARGLPAQRHHPRDRRRAATPRPTTGSSPPRRATASWCAPTDCPASSIATPSTPSSSPRPTRRRPRRVWCTRPCSAAGATTSPRSSSMPSPSRTARGQPATTHGRRRPSSTTRSTATPARGCRPEEAPDVAHAIRPATIPVVVTPRGFVVLAADTSPTLVSRIWAQVGAGRGLAAVLEALTGAYGTSLSAIPPFAVVLAEGDAVRLAVRGDIAVDIEMSTESERVSGTGVTTWSERVLTDVTRVLVEAAAPTAPADLPDRRRRRARRGRSSGARAIAPDHRARGTPSAERVRRRGPAPTAAPSDEPRPPAAAPDPEPSPSPSTRRGRVRADAEPSAPSQSGRRSPAARRSRRPAPRLGARAPLRARRRRPRSSTRRRCSRSPMPTRCCPRSRRFTVRRDDEPSDAEPDRPPPPLPAGADEELGRTVIRGGAPRQPPLPRSLGDHDGETISLAQAQALRAAATRPRRRRRSRPPRPPAPGQAPRCRRGRSCRSTAPW